MKQSNEQTAQQASYLTLIRATIQAKSNDTFATWYDGKGNPVNEYTFQQLWDEAGHCAWMLRNKLKLGKGDRVILCYGFGLHFFGVFLGCLRAGIIAVIVYPPGPPLAKSLTKMSKVAEDCLPSLILTETKINVLRLADLANPTSKSRSLWPKDIKYHTTDWLDRSTSCTSRRGRANNTRGASLMPRWMKPFHKHSGEQQQLPSFDDDTIQGSDIVFLQYTSGSTGNPKGVMITHAALAGDVAIMHDGWKQVFAEHGGCAPRKCAGFSWLPQYHDMGLIQMGLATLAAAWRMHMISPVSFIRNPVLWLQLISKHRCHISSAPDFAFQLVATKFLEAKKKPSFEMNRLDLSCLHHIQNAAEPIRLDTRSKFTDLFAPYGLSGNWFASGYGLAENVVCVSWYRGYQLSAPRLAEDCATKQYVAVGHITTFHRSFDLKIVHPDTCKVVDENVTGEIWVSGPSVAAGYYGRPTLSQETFQGRLEISDHNCLSTMASQPLSYLRTGDLGFLQDGYLYICGRMKDLIIVNGVNYYPQDVEHAVQDGSAAVRPGCVAAFSSNETSDDGQLEIVFELRSDQVKNALQVCQQVKSQVIQQVGLVPTRIVAIKERTIAKTTSGKIQRRRNRDLLHAGQHEVVTELVAPTLEEYAGTVGSSDDIDLEAGGIINQDQATKGESRSFNDIVASVLGHEPSPDETWNDIGLSSMAELELRDQLSTHFQINLSENCCQVFPTPSTLKAFVEASKGRPIPIELAELSSLDSITLPQSLHTAIQCVCMIIMLFLFAIPIIPAYEIGKIIFNLQNGIKIFVINLDPFIWAWYPLVVPVWIVALTIEIILVKWIIVGRYREGEVRVNTSMYYLRWWFVDRMVHIWERFIGIHLLNSPLLNLFYYCLGCNIHPSASVQAFIREFDLVHIGENCTVADPIRCRMFGPWEDDLGPSLRFRPINIEDNAVVKGMLCPGVTVGRWTKVDTNSVVKEGGQVPSVAIIKGNPAFIESVKITEGTNTSEMARGRPYAWWQMGLLKLCWYVFELYFVFVNFLAVQIAVQYRLPEWRYEQLLYWIVLLGLSSVGLTVTSIIFKWILIGRKKPGKHTPTLYSDFADWAVDFHYGITQLGLFMLLCDSKIITNLILKAHGMDIDMSSKVFPDGYPPSKVDLISVRRSFISTFRFDVLNSNADSEGNRTYQQIQIRDSSIGWYTTADAGVTLHNALVSPLTHLSQDIIESKADPRNVALTWNQSISYNIKVLTLHLFLLPLVGAAFIPAYDVWMNVMKPQTSPEAVFVLVICLVIQTLVWTFAVKALGMLALGPRSMHTNAENQLPHKIIPWSYSVYTTFLTFTLNVNSWTFEPLLWGTPLMKYLLRFLGSKVEDRILYFGYRIYEPQFITFADKVVVDESLVGGHYGVFQTLVLGPTFVGGVIHRKCFAMANSSASAVESGPNKLIPRLQESVK